MERVLIFVICSLLASCEIPQPNQFIENCLESHEESYLRMQPIPNGKVTSFMYIPSTRTVCDKSELIINPLYSKWIAEQSAIRARGNK
jgi:hypothetical protein